MVTDRFRMIPTAAYWRGVVDFLNARRKVQSAELNHGLRCGETLGLRFSIDLEVKDQGLANGSGGRAR